MLNLKTREETERYRLECEARHVLRMTEREQRRYLECIRRARCRRGLRCPAECDRGPGCGVGAVEYLEAEMVRLMSGVARDNGG